MKKSLSMTTLLLIAAACGDSSSPTAQTSTPTPSPTGAPTTAPTSTTPATTLPPTTTTPTTPGKVDPMAALLSLGASCSTDGWCWRGPMPSGNDYSRLFSTSPDNIWIIGQHGTVLQWNGTAWTAHHPPVQDGQPANQLPFSIAGTGPSDMWLIYNSTIQHWDGAAWTILDKVTPDGTIAFNNMWSAPDGEVWVTMSTGALKHGKAGAPLQILNTNCNCYLGNIWGTSSTDLFITTLGDGILHYDGTSFTSTESGGKVAADYVGVPNDVWVAGGSSALLHWDGKAWTDMNPQLPNANYYVSNVARLAADDIWWWAQDSSAQSAFIHWDGKSLTTTALDTSDIGAFLYSAKIIDGKWWFVGGGGRVYTKTDDGKLQGVIVPPINGQVQDMWGSSDNDMYFATGGTLVHYDGKTFSEDDDHHFHAISGIHRADGTNELFAIGDELTDDRLDYIADAYHFDGTTWTKTQLDHSTVANQQFRFFEKVHALGPNEAIAVGYKGIAYRYSNGSWTTLATGGVTTDLMSVWGPDADHAWVAGTAGTILKWERSNPDALTPDTTFPSTTEDLGPVHGAEGVMWVGARTNVYRTTASGWQMIDADNAVGGLFAISATNVIVSAPGQSLLSRYDGTSFHQEDLNSGLAAPIVFVPPGGTEWAAWDDVLLKHE